MSSGICTDILLATKDDLEEIGRFLSDLGGPFFHERFPGKSAADFYRWKYFANPAGNALIGVAKSGSRIVSLVAAVPKRISCDGETGLAYELGDFLTAPDHRKQGLFTKLIDLVCTEAARRDAVLAYVRPNDYSFPILQKHLQFEEPRQFDTRRFVTPSATLGRRTGVPVGAWKALGVDRIMRAIAVGGSAQGITIEHAENFHAADELWNRARDDYRFVLIRDRAYLDWRFVASPTPYRIYLARRSGQPTGYAVTFQQQGDAIGFIADLFTGAGDTATAQSLLSACIRDLVDASAASIYTWTLDASPESAAHRALVRACRFREPGRLHIAFRFLSPSWNRSRLPERSWHLTLGDFDGI